MKGSGFHHAKKVTKNCQGGIIKTYREPVHISSQGTFESMIFLSKGGIWTFSSLDDTRFLGGNQILDGGFKHCLFSPLFGEDSHFDRYFSKRSKKINGTGHLHIYEALIVGMSMLSKVC